MGEQEDVADGGLAGKKHYETVDADAQPAGGRHPVFQGGEEIGVGAVGFLVAVGVALPFLVGEAGALHRRVVQFGIRVGDFHAGGESLKAFHIAGPVRVRLGQGRHILRVVQQERRLDQVGFNIGGEHLVNQAAAGLAGGGFKAQFQRFLP